MYGAPMTRVMSLADAVAAIIVLCLWPRSFDPCTTVWEIVSGPSLAYEQGDPDPSQLWRIIRFCSEKSPTTLPRAQLHKKKWGSERACDNFPTRPDLSLTHFSIPKRSSAYLVTCSLRWEIHAQRNQCSLPRRRLWWVSRCFSDDLKKPAPKPLTKPGFLESLC